MEPCDARQVIESLYDRLDDLHFEVSVQKGIPAITSFDRAFSFIDDTLVAISELQSDTSTPLKERDELLELRTLLETLNESLEKLGACQSQVLYLHPLYSGSEHGEILAQWCKVMAVVRGESYRVRTLATLEWKARLGEMNHDFEALSLELGVLVESLQAAVHRLYFCSFDDVLTIAALARNPNAAFHMQPCFRNLFNFQSVSLIHDNQTKASQITSLLCERGEELPLLSPVELLCDLPGTPELSFSSWMGDLERHMMQSMRDGVASAVSSYSASSLRSWAIEGPAQCVLLALQVVYTKKVETAFQNYAQLGAESNLDRDLTLILHELSSQTSEVFLWVSSGNDTARVQHLLCTFFSLKRGVAMLLDQGVTSQHHVLWRKQLRWYIEHTPLAIRERRSTALDTLPQDSQVRVFCSMMDMNVDYHGEYTMPPPTTLLSTTDDVSGTQAAVFQLFHTKYAGCTLYHPRKGCDPSCVYAFNAEDFLDDLARNLGKKCHPVSCTAASTSAEIVRMLVGVFASGHWVVLKDVDLLDPAIIAVVCDGVASVRHALLSESPTYQFEGKVTPLLSDSFAVFCTLSGNDTSKITDAALHNLRRVLPPIAVPLVRSERILTQRFLLCGIDDFTGTLGRNTATALERLSFSGFDLDTDDVTTQLLLMLPQVVRALRPECARDAVVHSLYKVLSRTHTNSHKDLGVLMCSAFGQDAPLQESVVRLHDISERLSLCIKKRGLVGRAPFVSRCEQLYESLLTNSAVVLSGPPSSGKTAIWRVVQKGLLPQASCLMVFSALYDENSFFGAFDEANEWNDGIFTKLFRGIVNGGNAVETLERITIVPVTVTHTIDDEEELELPATNVVGSGEQHCIVLDGVPAPKILQRLLSVLDASRTLHLPNGEAIRAPPGFKILFEVSDRAPLPLSLSHFSKVCTHGTLLPSDFITYHASHPGFFLSAHKKAVITKLQHLIPPMLEWAHEQGLAREWDVCQDPTPEDATTAYFPVLGANLVQSCFNVINGFANKRKVSTRYTDDERGLSDTAVESILMFACVWSFGAALAVGMTQRVAFNQFFRNLVIDKGLQARYPMPMGDELGLVFDYVYDVGGREWLRWGSLPEADRPSQSTLCALRQHFISETAATVMIWLLKHLTAKGVNVLIAGPPGVGKSSLLTHALRNSVSVYCANATAQHLVSALGSQLQKARNNVIQLPDRLEKPLTLMLEAAELASTECFELLRQLHDNGGWYDTYSSELLTVQDVACTVCCDRDGILNFGVRHLSRFHFITHTAPESDELRDMLCQMLRTWVEEDPHNAKRRPPATEKEALRLKEIVDATPRLAIILVALYTEVQTRFTEQNDARSLWNLTVLSNVLQGMRLCGVRRATSLRDVLRMLINECFNSFGSRFEPSGKERRWVESKTWNLVLEHFPEYSRNTICRGNTRFWFGGLLDYTDHRSATTWRDIIADGTLTYAGALGCEASKDRQHCLHRLLYQGSDSVLSNVTYLMRALTRCRGGGGGHVLLLAQTYAESMHELNLAAFLRDAKVFRPEAQPYATMLDWRGILRSACVTAFVSTQPCVVVVQEASVRPAWLADVAAIAKHGDAAGLFSASDWASLTQTVVNSLRKQGIPVQGKAHIRQVFKAALLQRLHFVVVLDPDARSFSTSIRTNVVFQTHFQMVSLHSADRVHLQLACDAPPEYRSPRETHDATPEDSLNSSINTTPKSLLDICIDMFYGARDSLEVDGLGHGEEPYLANVDLSSASLKKMIALSGKLYTLLESANAREETKYRGCLEWVNVAGEEEEENESRPGGDAPLALARWTALLEATLAQKRTLRGDALFLAAFNTWGVAMAASEPFIKAVEDILLTHGIPCTPMLNIGSIADRMEEQGQAGLVSRWVAAGALRSCVPQCIALKVWLGCLPSICSLRTL